MKNLFHLPSSNEFDERSDEFFETRLAQRLQEKYEPKPYEKRFAAVRSISLVSSYFCNVFSILTASTFVFTYFFSVFAELPYPTVWASLLTGFILILIEALLRILAPLFFKNTLQFGFKSSYFTVLFAILALSGLSVFFSYNGGFDVVSTVTSPPTLQNPTLYDIEAVKAQYNQMIADADKDAESYKKSKLWGGRLSDAHASVYQKLLDKKASLKTELLAKIGDYEQLNRDLLATAKTTHQEELANYENAVLSKGGGLAVFAVIVQLVFFLCVFYMEYYDYKTVTQYASIPTSVKKKNPQQSPTLPTDGFPINNLQNGKHYPEVRNQIGFKIGQHKQPEIQLQQAVSEKTKTVFVEDRKTVFHNGKYYTLQGVNNFISIYQKRLDESSGKGKSRTAQKREANLRYWLGKREELLSK